MPAYLHRAGIDGHDPKAPPLIEPDGVLIVIGRNEPHAVLASAAAFGDHRFEQHGSNATMRLSCPNRRDIATLLQAIGDSPDHLAVLTTPRKPRPRPDTPTAPLRQPLPNRKSVRSTLPAGPAGHPRHAGWLPPSWPDCRLNRAWPGQRLPYEGMGRVTARGCLG